MTIHVVRPSTGETLRGVEEHGPEEVRERLARAGEAFLSWRRTPLAERCERLRRAAELLRSEQTVHAHTITEEMGKPITQAESEVEKCAWVCEYYAEKAGAFLAQEPAPSDASRSWLRHDPIGPILAVMPWNFPYWQVFRFAAPALAVGNVVLLKHASNVPGCALAIESTLARSGIPAGAFQTLLVRGGAVADLIADPAIRAVTITGSEAAGSKVAEAAGRALKKSVLELGGSDPFLVFADADLDAAAETAVRSRVINSGQTCISAKRFLVERACLASFQDKFAGALARLKVGDPLDRAVEVGPLARADLVEELDRQVAESVRRGARLVLGGKRLERPGFYYAPTLLADVRPGMPVFDEETFGPVAALAAVADEAEAAALANRSRYGLGAAVWTRDVARAERLVEQIETGCVFVNGMVKSDPRLPFGGVKNSGYGRELGRHGMLEFVNVKTVWVR